MTLNELFDYLKEHNFYVIIYLVGLPVLAGILGLFSGEKGNRDPWRYLYMLILYGICIPGIFAITLLIYALTYMKINVYEIDLLTHVAPVISMVVTILVVRKYVNLEEIPGFNKISGLLMMIAVVLVLFWILEKTRILVFTYMPFYWVLLILAALLLIFRMGLKKVF
jgi:hypothetical protein